MRPAGVSFSLTPSACAMETHEPLDPVAVRLCSVVTEMSDTSGSAHLLQERMVSWACVTAHCCILDISLAIEFHWTKRGLHCDPLSGKEGQQVDEGSIGVRNRPIPFLMMPSATDNGLDLRHALGGIREAHDEPSRLPWLDLNRARRHLYPLGQLALRGSWIWNHSCTSRLLRGSAYAGRSKPNANAGTVPGKATFMSPSHPDRRGEWPRRSGGGRRRRPRRGSRGGGDGRAGGRRPSGDPV